MSAVLAVTRFGLQAIFYTCLAFIAITSFYWPWWRTSLGWSLMLKTIALPLTIAPYMVSVFLGPRATQELWLQWVSAAAVLSVPPILVFRAAVIWWYQRHGRDPEGKPPPRGSGQFSGDRNGDPHRGTP